MCSEAKKVLQCALNCEEATQKVVDDLTHKNTLFIHELDKRTDEHFKNAEEKLDKHLERQEKARTREMTFNIFMFGIILGIVGYVAIESQKKANSADVLTVKEAKVIYELGDAYNKTLFIQKQNPQDTTNYKWVMKGIFSGSLRGGNIVINNK